MTRILLIDDDPMLLQLLKLFLENQGYQAFTAEGGLEGIKLAREKMPDLIILDLVMPGLDGLETCRRLREIGIQTILVISNGYNEKSMVQALEVGADAYLQKPFDLPVLSARIRTLLRRSGRATPTECKYYDDGHLLIDLDKRRIEVEGEAVQLTATEFRLLSILLNNVGRVVPHEELIQEVWGTDKESGLTSLKLYVYYLRRKIEQVPRKPYYLLAEWGIGYRLREPEPAAQFAG